MIGPDRLYLRRGREDGPEVVMRGAILWIGLVLAAVAQAGPPAIRAGSSPSDGEVIEAFGKQGIRLAPSEAAEIRADVRLALREAGAHGVGNSKVDFAAVEIADRLGLDTAPGSNAVRNVVAALRLLLDRTPPGCRPRPAPPEWSRYYERTLSLWRDPGFLRVVGEKGFSPVKISWEDIGRHEGSVWGDGLRGGGLGVRAPPPDPGSARLALAVRRDGNFRDKVLVVPVSAVKLHRRVGGRTVETTLPRRLAELGLASRSRDRHVIVSNQFAIVPVPARGRAAFTFSIYPYGSTNYVITDVIEGSHEAVVGPGRHQLLFADVDGRKAPFTASRAEDRPDLLRLERELKARGMDVDVQRYYLVQVPLRRDAGVRVSNMGAPPWRFAFEAGLGGGVPGEVVGDVLLAQPMAAPPAAAAKAQSAERSAGTRDESEAGLARVAIGTGDTEGRYDGGDGFRGARAEEPIRVTVVYFVTPVGEITRTDMESFAEAFAGWDEQAIWGGSFVTKEPW
jgi:hypothetical protein